MFDSTAAPRAAAIPHRRELRRWLLPLSRRDTALALGLFALDVALFALTIAAVIVLRHPALKVLAGLCCGIVIARLFVLGHDACHQSYTDDRRLNAWLGRLAFLPSLTPYSLWDVGHNVVHHGYTNLRGFDFIWQPPTPEEFSAMSSGRRLLQRIYRSGWAPGLYYLVEVWWRHLYFPSPEHLPTRRRVFRRDSQLVSGFALLWVLGLVAAARASEQSVLLLVATGFVLPFLVWNWIMGFIVYVHHTHPAIVWHANKAAWSSAVPFVSTTVHLRFRRRAGFDAGALLHHITEHTAHHVDMSIPLYRLRAAQALLEERLPGAITIQDFSWRWYFDTARRCKLYDDRAGRWTDFAGQPTH